MRLAAFIVRFFAACAVATAFACTPADQHQAQQAASDALVIAQVRARIAAVDPATVSLIQVRYRSGVATLSGEVATARERASIEDAARAVDGVREVLDHVTINAHAPTGAQIASDLELNARVRAALAAQTGVNAARIHVDAHRGVVTLSGTLPTAAHREVADGTVRALPGVRQLIDDIEIAPK
jgi:osmotically-inducible protein OsmY